MGLYDYFEPDPPIGCARPQCTGTLHGWQGKHKGHALFLWRQGRLDPEDQAIPKELQAEPRRRAEQRLPANEAIPAVYPSCDRCDLQSRLRILCITDAAGLWFETRIDHKIAMGELVDGWIICQECSDAWPEVQGKTTYICPSCDSVILRAH